MNADGSASRGEKGTGLVSVVIPVYCEEANIEELVRRTLDSLRGLARPFELILVDDGSRDDSARMIESAALEYPGEVVGVLLTRNFGQHAAVMAGLAESRGDVVVTLDADLQNPPEEIPKLVVKMDEGYDVVGSVRANRQDSFFRRMSSRLINRSVRASTGVDMHDYGCMLRAYRRGIVDAMLQYGKHGTFIPVLANSFANRTAEVEVAHAARDAGESRYNFWKLIRLQFDLVTSMTTWPLRALTILGGLMAVAGFGLGVLLLGLRLFLGPEWAVDGTFTLFAALFVFIGAQFTALGLLGEYIGRIYESHSAPWYLVRRTTRGRAGEVPRATPSRPLTPEPADVRVIKS
ncbi:MAG: glycosyltransferase [Planctomycetes bacterium]|nr:glycosyltransferase [Planctomycetota bacterium]MCB9903402.1 glycosyltransferase [Planctomycetota bacterium]